MDIVQVHNPQPKKILRIELMKETLVILIGYCFKDSHWDTHRWDRTTGTISGKF